MRNFNRSSEVMEDFLYKISVTTQPLIEWTNSHTSSRTVTCETE